MYNVLKILHWPLKLYFSGSPDSWMKCASDNSISSAFALILYRAFFYRILYTTRFIVPNKPGNSDLRLILRAATLSANWVYWSSSSDFGQAQRSPSQATCTHVYWLSLGWGILLALAWTQDTRNHGLVPFDGRKEPRMIISPMWPGIEPGTCHLLDNH
jgi:hypothetical protein